MYSTGPTRETLAEQKFLYRHDKSNEPTKKGPPSFAFFESTFISVSTAGRGQPSLVSLNTILYTVH